MSAAGVLALATGAERRQWVRRALEGERVELFGVVATLEALRARASLLKPALVLLVGEPSPDTWAAAISAVRAAAPECAVLAWTPADAESTASAVAARRAGADAVVTSAEGALAAAALTSKVREVLAGAPLRTRVESSSPPRAPAPLTSTTITGLPRRKPACLVIGSSTGGPRALEAVLGALPADFELPIVIVQHMPAGFTANLAQSLSEHCPFAVREARGGESLARGSVLVAPGDRHVRITGPEYDARVELDHGPPRNFCRPSVDVLFESAAEIFGGATLALVLTGMGQDGLVGAEKLRARGARVIVQDESTSVVWGMPGAIARAGLADEVAPIGELAGRLVQALSTLGRPSARSEPA